MFRTFLVLLFLAACGVYFHQHTSAPVPSGQSSAPKESGMHLDDSSLLALKKVLPAQLFEKDLQPVIDKNRNEGLSSAQLSLLLSRLHEMSKELSGSASKAASDAARNIEQAMNQEQSLAAKSSNTVEGLAKKATETMKESMPALKEISGEILNGMVAVLSQILSSAAELLKK
ncbi:hypothetical protein [Mailhella sp.]